MRNASATTKENTELTGISLISVHNLSVEFEGRSEGVFTQKRYLRAVHDVSFDINAGESIGMVGESGCGKSTIARVLVGLQRPTAGSIRILGNEIDFDNPRHVQSQAQIVFQDPYSSLNPRLRIWNQVSEPLRGHKGVKNRTRLREAAAEALEQVGLERSSLDRFPHQFSGGQRQRIAIARALVLRPALLIADEPMSSLDVSSQSHIAEVLKNVCAEHNIAMLLISHDLPGISALTNRTIVIYLGRVFESGPTRDVLRRPAHPYTQALIGSAPRLGGGSENKIEVSSDVPSPYDPPSGCAFHPRCPVAEPRCRDTEPKSRAAAEGHNAACHLVGEE